VVANHARVDANLVDDVGHRAPFVENRHGRRREDVAAKQHQARPLGVALQLANRATQPPGATEWLARFARLDLIHVVEMNQTQFLRCCCRQRAHPPTHNKER
jgi:hypothetical protein